MHQVSPPEEIRRVPFGRLFTAIPDPAIVGDVANGRIILWNPAAEAMFGYSAAEACQLNVEMLVPERLRRTLVTRRMRYAATRQGTLVDAGRRFRAVALHRDGSEFAVELTLSVVTPALGARRHVLAILHDLTERQRLEAERDAAINKHLRLLEEAQTRLRRLELVQRISAAVNASGDLDDLLRRVLAVTGDSIKFDHAQIALVDPDRRRIRGRVGLGLPPGLQESTVRTLFSAPDPAEDMLSLIVRTDEQMTADDTHPALHGPTLDRFNLRNQHRVLTPISHAGKVIGVLGAAWLQPPTDGDRAVLRLVAEQVGGAIARARLIEADQQARRHAEQEHARLLTVIEASDDAIFLKDLTGRYVLVNAAKARMLQCRPEHIIGRFDRELGPPSYWEPAVVSDQQVVAIGKPAVRYQTVDIGGVTRIIYVIKTPLRDHAGGIIGIVGVLRDVTEPARLAEERDAAHAAQARAEGAVRTGRAVAHELASPLGAILALAEIMASDSRLPDDLRGDLNIIQEQATRAGDLLKRFRSIIRYAEQETPIGPQLDVREASR